MIQNGMRTAAAASEITPMATPPATPTLRARSVLTDFDEVSLQDLPSFVPFTTAFGGSIACPSLPQIPLLALNTTELHVSPVSSMTPCTMRISEPETKLLTSPSRVELLVLAVPLMTAVKVTEFGEPVEQMRFVLEMSLLVIWQLLQRFLSWSVSVFDISRALSPAENL